MAGRAPFTSRELSSVGPRGSGLGVPEPSKQGDPPEALSGGEYTGTISPLLPPGSRPGCLCLGSEVTCRLGQGSRPFWWKIGMGTVSCVTAPRSPTLVKRSPEAGRSPLTLAAGP